MSYDKNKKTLMKVNNTAFIKYARNKVYIWASEEYGDDVEVHKFIDYLEECLKAENK